MRGTLTLYFGDREFGVINNHGSCFFSNSLVASVGTASVTPTRRRWPLGCPCSSSPCRLLSGHMCCDAVEAAASCYLLNRFPCENPGFHFSYVRHRSSVTGNIGCNRNESSGRKQGRRSCEREHVTSDTSSRARFGRIFGEHHESVSRYCHRRLPSDDANDATAEVFVVAWKKIENMPPGDHTLLWLYGVARNEVRRFRRSIRRRRALQTKLSGQASYPDPGPEIVVVRNAERERLVGALERLKPQDQEVLRLRAYEHLTLAEVAIVLGCSVPAAKQRSARAVKRLRRAANLPGPQGAMPGSRAMQKGGDG